MISKVVNFYSHTLIQEMNNAYPVNITFSLPLLDFFVFWTVVTSLIQENSNSDKRVPVPIRETLVRDDVQILKENPSFFFSI